MSPPHTQVFEDGITVTPVSSHTYTANVQPDWSIGAVPHGGYTMSILYRLATTHFKHTHPTRHNSQPLPISMQMTFLRRTAAGPATLTVEDSKLGLRTSTIHVTLSQEDDSSSSSSAKKQNKKLTAKVVGYITVSDPISDVGPSFPSAWELRPPAPSRGPPSVVVTPDNSDKRVQETGCNRSMGATAHSDVRFFVDSREWEVDERDANVFG
ncbi:hypothetical protein ZTR_03376 [Talaromyces verruculosus]|nr:hypothetical protein ZTR_03376 [Talaromyces verruculosus]